MKLMGYSNSGDDWPSVFISPDNSAHNVTRVMLKRPLRFFPPQRPVYT